MVSEATINQSLELLKTTAGLESSCAYGFLDAVKFSVDNDVKITGNCLVLAAKNGHSEVVKFLIENGASLSEPVYSTAIVDTVRNNDLDAFKLMVDVGFMIEPENVDYRGIDHDSCAAIACGSGNLDFLNELKKYDVDLFVKSSGLLPIEYAFNNHNDNVVEYFLDNYSREDIGKKWKKNKSSQADVQTLAAACAKSNYDKYIKLFSHDDFFIRDHYTRSNPLDEALKVSVDNQNFDQAKLCLDLGADPNPTYCINNAVANRDYKIMNLLLDYDADVIIKDSQGHVKQAKIYESMCKNLYKAKDKDLAEKTKWDRGSEDDYKLILSEDKSDEIDAVERLVKHGADANAFLTGFDDQFVWAEEFFDRVFINNDVKIESSGAKNLHITQMNMYWLNKLKSLNFDFNQSLSFYSKHRDILFEQITDWGWQSVDDWDVYAKFLKESGYDFNKEVKDNDSKPLVIEIVKKLNAKEIEKVLPPLVKNGLKLTTRGDGNKSIFHYAVADDDVEKLKMLEKIVKENGNKPKIDVKDAKQRSALMYSIWSDSEYSRNTASKCFLHLIKNSDINPLVVKSNKSKWGIDYTTIPLLIKHSEVSESEFDQMSRAWVDSLNRDTYTKAFYSSDTPISEAIYRGNLSMLDQFNRKGVDWSETGDLKQDSYLDYVKRYSESKEVFNAIENMIVQEDLSDVVKNLKSKSATKKNRL